MKPYSILGVSKEQAITNYRISWERRVVENSFSILAHRWQTFLSTMMQIPNTGNAIVEACVCLLILIRMRYLDMEDDLNNF